MEGLGRCMIYGCVLAGCGVVWLGLSLGDDKWDNVEARIDLKNFARLGVEILRRWN